jgi:Icc-related predicted phosphoesterase
MKILCTSDYHLSASLAEGVVKLIEKEKPDVFIAAGDFLSHSYAKDFLKKIKIKTFVVPGNWDAGLKFKSEHVTCEYEHIEEYKDYWFMIASEDGFYSDELLLQRTEEIDGKKLVFITHYPPHGILDFLWDGRSVGFEGFRQFVDKKKPMLHVFGHIHESAGIKKTKSTLFVNAALEEKRVAYLVELPSKKVMAFPL